MRLGCDAYDDFVTWNAALLDAGAEVRFRRWSDDAVRAALADFWTRTGRPPATTADLTADAWSGPKASTFRRRYGGTKQAWAILDVPPAADLDIHMTFTICGTVDGLQSSALVLTNLSADRASVHATVSSRSLARLSS